ncbi:hypothetical protein [Alkalihalobacterium bogoriense]|uniref:hypothetical protein n=1 Tax=Alkalihalobacterium bogoriense TaxID=246272 RepID=UPI0006867CB2|nr:hypothetical protein [Alkalihalobacterium bogoriense]
MKNNFYWILFFIGVAVGITSIILAVFGADILGISFIREELVPIAFGFLGVMLITMSVFQLIYEKTKTKKQYIEEKDERNILIHERAKSKAFDLIFVLFPLILLTLAILGYMNHVSFFTLYIVYFICLGYFAYQLILQKKIV